MRHTLVFVNAEYAYVVRSGGFHLASVNRDPLDQMIGTVFW